MNAHRPSIHTGILLVNLGTPQAPRPAAVRRYLREFLGDPRVLDMPAAARWLLLNAVILPWRPARSARAYQKIWTPEGSPLLAHSTLLAAELDRAMGSEVAVALGMRYGSPSLQSALETLRAQRPRRLVVVPLYPQYASSTTGSTLEEIYRVVGSWWNVPSLRVVEPFYGHPAYLEAMVQRASEELAAFAPDHVLFSFHGLPERQIRKGDPTGGQCLSTASCCDREHDGNRHCYRAQAHATYRALRAKLGLERTSIAFQSRLGRLPWIGPHTDTVLSELGRQGVGRLAVICPAFTADCLETLEEIGMRGAATFRAAGGGELKLIPSLNAHPAWVEALEAMVGPHLASPVAERPA